MLRIGVCDGRKDSKEYLERLIQKSGVKCKLYSFRTREEITQNKEKMDVWLLDIGQLEECSLEEILKQEEKNRNKEERIIVVKAGTTYHSLAVKDVYFAENNGRKIILHKKESALEFYGKMEELEQELGEGFFRCHRGYLVSLSKVTGYDNGNIYLDNEESVYLAKRKYCEFVKTYMNYLNKNKEC